MIARDLGVRIWGVGFRRGRHVLDRVGRLEKGT